MTPEEKVRRANKAAQLLNDEVYREAWASLDANLMANWAATNQADQQRRETLYFELTGLRAVKVRLERWVAEGREAAAEIERTKQRATGKRTSATV